MSSIHEVRDAIAPSAIRTRAVYETVQASEAESHRLAETIVRGLNPSDILKIAFPEADYAAAGYFVRGNLIAFMTCQEAELRADIRAALGGERSHDVDGMRSRHLAQLSALHTHRAEFESSLSSGIEGMSDGEVMDAVLPNVDGYSARGQLQTDVRSAALGSAVLIPTIRDKAA